MQEHHLQRAISAQQVYGEKRDNMVIPVPEAESNITYYESLYPGDYKMPKQLIHIQREWASLTNTQHMQDFGFVIVVIAMYSSFPAAFIKDLLNGYNKLANY